MKNPLVTRAHFYTPLTGVCALCEADSPDSQMSGLFCVTPFRARRCTPCNACASKAKDANLQRYAEAFSFLQSKNLYTVDDLDNTLHAMQDKIDTLKKSASSKQARIKEVDELLRMVDYAVISVYRQSHQCGERSNAAISHAVCRRENVTRASRQ